MHFVGGFDRTKTQQINYEQEVPADSWARVVDAFVDILPLDKLGFKTTTCEEGRPPYHPADMLKLLLYCYKEGIRSSRQIARACKINIEVRWLLKGLTPSRRKICYFRKENAEAIDKVFDVFVQMLKELDLIEGRTIAIDSFKIRAQNAIKKNFNEKKLDRHIKYNAEKIKEYQEKLQKTNNKEEQEAIKRKIKEKKDRIEEYKQIKKN